MKYLLEFVTLALATTASAAILHDNGAPLLGPPPADADRSDADNGVQRGDRITVSTAETLQSIQWWGIYGFTSTPQSADAFTLRIYSIVSGTPNQNPLISISLLTATRQPTTGKIGGITVFLYDSTIPNTMLAPGDYVFSLMNDTTAETGYSWFWADSTVTSGTAYERNASTDPWSQVKLGDTVNPTPVASHAFNLSGLVIPEPTTLSLLGVASLGLAFKRHRKGSTARLRAARV